MMDDKQFRLAVGMRGPVKILAGLVSATPLGASYSPSAISQTGHPLQIRLLVG